MSIYTSIAGGWGCARPGSVYIAVLSVAMLVTVIGLSALQVVRVEQRAVTATESAVQADVFAQAVLDLALFRIAGDLNWRSTYTHDTWTSEQTVGDVSFSFKLRDERDADLADDTKQPVRLYGKATAGDAVRIYSVLLQPTGVYNLLTNADMEAGTTDWTGRGYCDLTADASDPYAGAMCIQVTSRDYTWAGPNQDITGRIASGTTYDTQVWAKMESGLDEVRVVVCTRSTGDGEQWEYFTSSSLIGTSWTSVSGTITPTWSGTLQEAWWYVGTTFGQGGFKIDDAVLIEADAGPPLVPLPGTCRREVLP